MGVFPSFHRWARAAPRSAVAELGVVRRRYALRVIEVMSAALVRIALLQFITVILSVLLAGFTLKVRFGSGSHFPILATYTRDYGIWLLLIPFAWGVWGALENNRPKAGLGDAGSVFLIGVLLLIALAFFGFFSFMSACSHNSLIRLVPAQGTVPTPQPEHP